MRVAVVYKGFAFGNYRYGARKYRKRAVRVAYVVAVRYVLSVRVDYFCGDYVFIIAREYPLGRACNNNRVAVGDIVVILVYESKKLLACVGLAVENLRCVVGGKYGHGAGRYFQLAVAVSVQQYVVVGNVASVRVGDYEF